MDRCERSACATVGFIRCTDFSGSGGRLDCFDIVTLHEGREES